MHQTRKYASTFTVGRATYGIDVSLIADDPIEERTYEVVITDERATPLTRERMSEVFDAQPTASLQVAPVAEWFPEGSFRTEALHFVSRAAIDVFTAAVLSYLKESARSASVDA